MGKWAEAGERMAGRGGPHGRQTPRDSSSLAALDETFKVRVCFLLRAGRPGAASRVLGTVSLTPALLTRLCHLQLLDCTQRLEGLPSQGLARGRPERTRRQRSVLGSHTVRTSVPCRCFSGSPEHPGFLVQTQPTRGPQSTYLRQTDMLCPELSACFRPSA